MQCWIFSLVQFLPCDFIENLKESWRVGLPAIFGYSNALLHLLVLKGNENGDVNQLFMATEVYLSRSKKSLGKKMRLEWNTLLNIDHLSKLNCWATLEELQNVIPFYAERFS